MKQVWVLLVAAMVVVASGEAEARTYRCEASPKKALLGISAVAAVSITEDSRNRECRFSVNGEPTGSPPRQLVIAAYNQFRSGEIVQSPKADTLVYALLASSPEQDVPDGMIQTFNKHIGELSQCIRSLAQAAIGSFLSDPRIFCRVAPGSEPVRADFEGGGIQVQPTVPGEPPLMMIGYNAGTLRHYLFISTIFVIGRLPPLK